MFTWCCPSCGATENDHDDSDIDECNSKESCPGFICMCSNFSDNNHGATIAERCKLSKCFHCGWEGPFPTLTTVPRIDEFAKAIESIKSLSNSKASRKKKEALREVSARKARVIFHEWVDTALDKYLEEIDNELTQEEFGELVLSSVWWFMYASGAAQELQA